MKAPAPLDLICHDFDLWVLRLERDEPSLPELVTSDFAVEIRTPDERTLVIAAERAPLRPGTVGPWRAFAVVGPLEFSLTGIVATLATTLAQAGISLMAFSTYETDWILVRREVVEEARSAFEAAGHRVDRRRRQS